MSLRCQQCSAELLSLEAACPICGTVPDPVSAETVTHLEGFFPEADAPTMLALPSDLLEVPATDPPAPASAPSGYSGGIRFTKASAPVSSPPSSSGYSSPSSGYSSPSGVRPVSAISSAVSSRGITPPPSSTPSSQPSSSHPSSAPQGSTPGGSGLGDDQELAPGTLLAGRYRVAMPVGKGGMGRVYRADDLKLGQTVALKFLPTVMSNDTAWLSRFLSEVRTAREVTHANVCRVHDIVEVEADNGQSLHFLTMEYVDGENLSALIKRFGKLPTEKALEMAAQITAGLAAAHARGVLHRDLKPANIMVDGRGQAKITDFGLATIAQDSVRNAEVAGTPGFMAPELFKGLPASGRSDLYSLGLVLYELLTGRPPFKGKDLKDRRQPPTPILKYAPKVPPEVEHVILQCLDPDPGQRPASAAQVLKSLPLVDALDAAIARGETPSPDMLAASDTETALVLWKAWALMLLCIAGTLGCLLLSPKATILGQQPAQLTSDEMTHRSQEILHSLGYPERAYNPSGGYANVSWLQDNSAVANYMSEHMGKAADVDLSNPEQGPLLLTYRTYGKGSLLPIQLGTRNVPTQTDPAANRPGMISIDVDSDGHLIRLVAMPSQDEAAGHAASMVPDYNAAFAAAGLDLALFHPIKPYVTPPVAVDMQMAWEGTYPGHPDTPVQFTADSWFGKFVYLRVATPWNQPLAVVNGLIAASWGQILFYLAFFITAIPLVRHNLAMRRGDTRGAYMLSGGVFVLMMLAGLCGMSLTNGSDATFAFFLTKMAYALLAAALTWLAYVAMEPFARKRVPRLLISSTLLLQKKFNSPTLARDVLFGSSAAFLAVGVEFALTTLLRTHFHHIDLLMGEPRLLDGVLPWADTLLTLGGSVLMNVVLAIPLFVILRVLLRNTWAAASVLSALILLAHISGAHGWSHGGIELLIEGTWAVLLALLMMRVGAVAVVVFIFACALLEKLPWTTQFNSWLSTPMLSSLAVLFALAGWSFYTALGDQKMFGFVRIED